MISYCGNASSLSVIWIEEGLSPCFYYTVSSALLAGIIILFGIVQLYFYYKHGSRLEDNRISRSSLFKLQLIVGFSLSVESILYLILQSTILENVLLGYQILSACLMAIAWLFACIITYIECRWILPTIPTRGHGLVLLTFLTLSFVVENIAFLSLHSPLWWFHERKYV